jgi:predicted sugar kinase
MTPSLELRGKNASYFIIAEILQQNGVKTSRARVAEYGRIVLDGGKSRKRRKRARTAPVANALATPQSTPAVAAKPAPVTTAPATTITSYVPLPPTEKFSIQVARTTHRQRENDESKRT